MWEGCLDSERKIVLDLQGRTGVAFASGNIDDERARSFQGVQTQGYVATLLLLVRCSDESDD